ncbi:alkaline phosphatase family protein [Reyranella sp.]|uniref:alkaline phosphatase family protein n=1 Tax=Reyranella sp. TaxID=1929291 RepID=UPI00120B4D12|nr:alkaline phosphatase family protein [Reyranella sp.]TAJ90047.1 MAG: nucleotide pyrophosphatase [Reyranella sp.]
MTSSRRRRAILIVCDGLGAEWINAERTPTLAALQAGHRSASDHRAVFPSVTRVSAASIATGCHPARHGLEGNQMALFEDGRLTVHNVGAPSFRQTMRQVTGQTLRVPTLAERLASCGGQVAYSNVSPGAAYFLDPDHFGTVLHRAGSFGPGGAALTGAAHLAVTHDLAGDIEMARRFCAEIVPSDEHALSVLWLANPDLTLHHEPLGSPEHLQALKVTDGLVREVLDAVRAHEDRFDTLVVVGSDHGHETVGRSIHIARWLSENGLEAELRHGRIAVASQGTSALIYATEKARPALEGVFPHMRHEPWVGAILTGEMLAATGLSGKMLFAAVDTARHDERNGYGVAGTRWLVEDGEGPPEIGCGHHGGLGPQETRPFLVLVHPDFGQGRIERTTSLVDIAPTILSFLGQPVDRFDGTAVTAGQ